MRPKVPQGLRTEFSFPLIDPNTGQHDQRWASADTPEVRVWPGGGRDYVLADSVTWDGDPANGATVQVVIEAATTADLEQGLHLAEVLVTSGGVTTAVSTFRVEVQPAPTATAGAGDDAPAAYIDGDDLRTIGRPFLETLGGHFDQTSLANLAAQARRDLDDLIASRFADRSAGGLSAADLEAEYDRMRGWLDAGGLKITATVKRYNVFRTIFYLSRSAVGGAGPRDSIAALRRLGDQAEQQADETLRQLTAFVNGDGGTIVVRFGGATRLER